MTLALSGGFCIPQATRLSGYSAYGSYKSASWRKEKSKSNQGFGLNGKILAALPATVGLRFAGWTLWGVVGITKRTMNPLRPTLSDKPLPNSCIIGEKTSEL